MSIHKKGTTPFNRRVGSKHRLPPSWGKGRGGRGKRRNADPAASPPRAARGGCGELRSQASSHPSRPPPPPATQPPPARLPSPCQLPASSASPRPPWPLLGRRVGDREGRGWKGKVGSDGGGTASSAAREQARPALRPLGWNQPSRSLASRPRPHEPRRHRRHLRLHVNTRRAAGGRCQSAQPPRAPRPGRCARGPASPGPWSRRGTTPRRGAGGARCARAASGPLPRPREPIQNTALVFTEIADVYG